MIKQNQKILNFIQLFLDGISIAISLALSWYIRFRSGFIGTEGGYLSFYSYLKPSIIIIPIYLILFNLFKMYTPRRIRTLHDEMINIIKANILGILFYILLLFLIKELDYSRYYLFVFAITCTIIIFLERSFTRLILRKVRRKGYNLKHIILVGYADIAKELLYKVGKNKQWGYHISGIFDDKLFEEKNIYDEKAISIQSINNKKVNVVKNIKVLGKIEDLDDYLNKKGIDEVFITLGLENYKELGNIIEVCEKNGVRTQIIPDYYKYIPAKPYVEEIDGLPVINTRYIPLDNIINKVIKRLFDIIMSIIIIILFSPIMILTCVIIKLTSPGPIIFKQERVGFNRKKFTMYKFRSMNVQKKEEEKLEWTTEKDPRKTKFGAFIRKTSIDELPQFFNVLKGDMSIIGPRPERDFFVKKFKEEIPKYMVKHQVRPGITGWAQVNGLRGDTSISKRIELDIYYIENWRLSLDIEIVFLTVLKGFINSNAY